jgi:hypothetical protein
VFPLGGSEMETDSTNFNQQADEFEARGRPGARRNAAASSSTWTSVAVNIALSGLQISVGLLAKSQGLNAMAFIRCPI